MTHFFWSPTSPIDPAHFTHTYGRSGKRRWLTHREFYNLSCSERPSWNEAYNSQPVRHIVTAGGGG